MLTDDRVSQDVPSFHAVRTVKASACATALDPDRSEMVSTTFKSLALATVLALSTAANAHAQNVLNLVIHRSGHTDSLTLSQVGLDYEGELNRNGVPLFAYAVYSGDVFFVQLGDQISDLHNYWESETTYRYVGSFDAGLRPVDLTAEITANGRKVVIEGTVGGFDVTATLQDQSLRLFWDDNKLMLSNDGNGACSGEIRRRGETSPVTCATSGTLMDALFTDTGKFLGFLVNLAVR